MKLRRLALIAAAALLLGFCEKGPKDLAGGSETGNVALTVHVYDTLGNPVAGATLSIIPAYLDPQIVNDTSNWVTDSLGVFKLATLPADSYNVFAMRGLARAFTGPVTVPDSGGALVIDTLKVPGSLSGIVGLEPGDDPRKVLVLVMGSAHLIAYPDSAGLFDFSTLSLAEGAYRIRFVAVGLPDYDVLDTTLLIASGINAALSDTVRLKFTGTPKPKNVKIQYDTLKQIVTLSWDKEDTALVKGYNIYRQNMLLNGNLPVSGTSYRDSTGLQDSTYDYQVAAVNFGNMEGSKSAAASAKFESAYKLIATFGKGTGTGPGYFNSLSAVAIDKFGNIFAADAGNKRIQKFDSLGNFLLQWGGPTDTLFSKPQDIETDSVGNVYVADFNNNQVQKFTNNGVFIKTIGGLNHPSRIWIHGQNIYIGESNGQIFSVFDLDGTLLQTANSTGIVSGIVANDSLIFIILNENRVLKFTKGGNFIDTTYFSGKMPNGMDDIQITNLNLWDSTLFVLNFSEKKVGGLNFSGMRVVRFSLANASAEFPQDLSSPNTDFMFVAFQSGFIQKYGK